MGRSQAPPITKRAVTGTNAKLTKALAVAFTELGRSQGRSRKRVHESAPPQRQTHRSRCNASSVAAAARMYVSRAPPKSTASINGRAGLQRQSWPQAAPRRLAAFAGASVPSVISSVSHALASRSAANSKKDVREQGARWFARFAAGPTRHGGAQLARLPGRGGASTTGAARWRLSGFSCFRSTVRTASR